MTKLIPNGRIWVDTEAGPFLGSGRIELLEKIAEFGSLRKAAQDMKISYRQAWDFIDQMNKRAGKPLVISERGGRGGGGAVVTPEGHNAIRLFHELDHSFRAWLADANDKINQIL